MIRRAVDSSAVEKAPDNPPHVELKSVLIKKIAQGISGYWEENYMPDSPCRRSCDVELWHFR
jgi:hypothetical protein